MNKGNDSKDSRPLDWRSLISRLGLTGAAIVAPITLGATEVAVAEAHSVDDAVQANRLIALTLNINNQAIALRIDPRASLLDTLRETAFLTGTKKGCDHGNVALVRCTSMAGE